MSRGKGFGLLQGFAGDGGDMGAPAEFFAVDDQFIKRVGRLPFQAGGNIGVGGQRAVDGEIFDLIARQHQLAAQPVGFDFQRFFAQGPEVIIQCRACNIGLPDAPPAARHTVQQFNSVERK